MTTFESRLKKLEALAGVPVSKHIERIMEMDDDAIAEYAARLSDADLDAAINLLEEQQE